MMKRLILILVASLAMLAIPAAAQDPFIGEVALVGFNFAPQGWAFCQGQLLSIQQNTALFALLGTQYGGNGTTNFALPDLRGRRIIGFGQGPGLSPYQIGEQGGEENVTLLVSEMPAHSHTANANTALGTSGTPANNFWASQTSSALYSNSPSPVAMSPAAVGFQGGSQPHNNMPPYLTMNYIIALQGIFPPRQ